MNQPHHQLPNVATQCLIELEDLQCQICLNYLEDCFECTSCSTLFCRSCIFDWLDREPTRCPMNCNIGKSGAQIHPLNKKLSNIILSVSVPCHQCGLEKILMRDYKDHLKSCKKPKCANVSCLKLLQTAHQTLTWNSPYSSKLLHACSLPCRRTVEFSQMLQFKKHDATHNKDLIDFFSETLKVLQESGMALQGGGAGFEQAKRGGAVIPRVVSGKKSELVRWHWDPSKSSNKVQITHNGCNLLLKEEDYKFRTVLGSHAFQNGRHYWEIIADSQTEHEMKLGVSKKTDFDLNSAFCDYNFGFAFYGVGQLRHGDNKAGRAYGRPFKKSGVLGVYLDMDNGVLAFSIDKNVFGPAFIDEQLKFGPIYPCVSMLHHAGCKLNPGVQIPEGFSSMKLDKDGYK